MTHDEAVLLIAEAVNLRSIRLYSPEFEEKARSYLERYTNRSGMWTKKYDPQEGEDLRQEYYKFVETRANYERAKDEVFSFEDFLISRLSQHRNNPQSLRD